MGRVSQIHHQHQNALVWIIFSYARYPTFIYTETPMPTVCLLFHFVRYCRMLSLAWHLTALRRSGISRPGDFVHSPFCRLCMKMLNKTHLSKQPLLPPLHHQSPFICIPALNLLSVQKGTFPSKTWLSFSIDSLRRKKNSKDSEELLK